MRPSPLEAFCIYPLALLSAFLYLHLGFGVTQFLIRPSASAARLCSIMGVIPMVRDGYLYALGLIAAAVLVSWFAPPAWALLPLLLAVFFLWFFRDPERAIPDGAGALVSPGDGKVT